MQIAKRKVLNFRKRYGCSATDTPVSLAELSWSEPERFVARRAAPHNPGWEVLIKWKGLGYEQATWEAESDPFLLKPVCVDLARALWERQAAALHRASPEALESAQAARIASRGELEPLEATPEAVAAGGELLSHQL